MKLLCFLFGFIFTLNSLSAKEFPVDILSLSNKMILPWSGVDVMKVQHKLQIHPYFGEVKISKDGYSLKDAKEIQAQFDRIMKEMIDHQMQHMHQGYFFKLQWSVLDSPSIELNKDSLQKINKIEKELRDSSVLINAELAKFSQKENLAASELITYLKCESRAYLSINPTAVGSFVSQAHDNIFRIRACSMANKKSDVKEHRDDVDMKLDLKQKLGTFLLSASPELYKLVEKDLDLSDLYNFFKISSRYNNSGNKIKYENLSEDEIQNVSERIRSYERRMISGVAYLSKLKKIKGEDVLVITSQGLNGQNYLVDNEVEKDSESHAVAVEYVTRSSVESF